METYSRNLVHLTTLAWLEYWGSTWWTRYISWMTQVHSRCMSALRFAAHNLDTWVSARWKLGSTTHWSLNNRLATWAYQVIRITLQTRWALSWVTLALAAVQATRKHQITILYTDMLWFNQCLVGKIFSSEMRLFA